MNMTKIKYSKLSIAIPTYESSQYVEESIKKIMNFKCVNEVVIQDDRSSNQSYGELEKIVKMVFAHKLLSTNGVLILEHSKEQDYSELPFFTNSRRYGNVNFSFFEWLEEEND